MEDLYEMRCLLEVQAAKTAVFRITDEELDALEERFRRLLADYESSGRPEPQQFSALDWALHELIVERCQNNYIKTIMKTNNSNMRRYQLFSMEARNNIRESTRQHLDILALLRSRDMEDLTQALPASGLAADFLKRCSAPKRSRQAAQKGRLP